MNNSMFENLQAEADEVSEKPGNIKHRLISCRNLIGFYNVLDNYSYVIYFIIEIL
jgi:hypothetical protein